MALFCTAIWGDSVSLSKVPLLCYSFESFLHKCLLIVSHWSLSDSKSSGLFSVFRPISIMLLSGWSLLVICKSSSPFTNPLGIVLSAPTTISITATFMFHFFFSFLARSKYLSLFLLSSIFLLLFAGTAESMIQQLFFFFCWYY